MDERRKQVIERRDSGSPAQALLEMELVVLMESWALSSTFLWEGPILVAQSWDENNFGSNVKNWDLVKQ